METSTFGPITDWNEVIKKEVKGLNDADFGEVQEVNENYVLTQRGTLNKEKFYLPKSIPHGYNGRILLFDITEEEAKKRFVIDKSTLSASEGGEKEIQRQDPERPIPVIEERLEISKKETIVEAKVIKKPVKETKTVEVELVHEELIIEKRPVGEGDKTITLPSPTSTTTPQTSPSLQEVTQSKIEISIPLKKEDVVVSKKSFVKEEIIIKKKPVTETKTITEQLISEKVSIINANGEEVIEEVRSEKQ
jgi:stress response protein YsnF